MVGPPRSFAWAASASSASARPRISTQRTRHGSTDGTSSTTNATFPLSATLRNLRLAAMLYPWMSIVVVAAL
ncbi:hypothetical protein JOJ86_003110 [Rhodococcus percolatus]|nr:hypothetical protein [Rhodococcus opacus]MBP2205384.1 hypothetical protein [Rhodococcus opacus]CAG7604962.1 hypothetical protein E143388_05319 [Rhodococcus opacus]